MEPMELKLCDIQGRLFESFLQTSYGSESLIRAFMNSKLAVYLDSEYNRMQWVGEEYLLEEFLDEQMDTLSVGEQYSREVMYWSGYLYRYWHYATGESSKKIYRQAGAKTMSRNYMMFHTMDPELAIEDLKEIDWQRKRKI